MERYGESFFLYGRRLLFADISGGRGEWEFSILGV